MLAQRAVNFIDRFSTALVYIATACVAFMMILGVLDTLSSKIINRPLSGYFELTEVSMVLTIVLPLAFVQGQRRHITMTALTELMPRRLQILLDLLGLSIALFALFALVWASGRNAWRSVQIGEYYPALVQYPVYPWKIAFVLGFVALTAKVVADIVKNIAVLFGAAVPMPPRGRTHD